MSHNHINYTPSVRKYLSPKWIKGDVSRCILVLDTSILMTSNSGWREYLVQTRNKVGVGEFSMYIGLGTNRKERG